MRILAIETSCDETSVAILKMEGDIAVVDKEMTATQISTHQAFGGVVPEVAARMHVETLPAILKEMGVTKDSVDAISATRGPGLVTSLRIGVDAARSLAYSWGKPLLGINHIEGHIAANWIGKASDAYAFPAVVLVVSGGHTELILMKDFGQYELLGATQDDAAGEAFDKVAKMLNLGYPGGPAVSKRAANGDSKSWPLPRPMLHADNFDFSFSGLKTAVLYSVERKKDWTEKDTDNLCASFQTAVIDTLVGKTARAAKVHGAKTVFLAGGVAANKGLREALKIVVERDTEAQVVLPDLKWCTDNAAMIGMAAAFRLAKGEAHDWTKMEPDPNWELGR